MDKFLHLMSVVSPDKETLDEARVLLAELTDDEVARLFRIHCKDVKESGFSSLIFNELARRLPNMATLNAEFGINNGVYHLNIDGVSYRSPAELVSAPACHGIIRQFYPQLPSCRLMSTC